MSSGTKTNRFGLTRKIPAPTKRAVREQCGFGCIVCGNAICQYHHYDPEWKDARDHLAPGIALLCGTCHDKVFKRILSPDKIYECRIDPICKRNKNAFGEFDLDSQNMTIAFGECRFVEPSIVLRIFNVDLLFFREPEISGGPPRLSGKFFNRDGELCFSIEDNIFEYPQTIWDAEWRGPMCTIRRGKRDIALRLHICGRNKLVIDRLNMYYKGVRVMADPSGIWVGPKKGKGISFRGQCFKPECCIEVRKRSQ